MDFVSSRPKPLALYLFSRDKKVQKQVLTRRPSAAAASTTPSSTSPPPTCPSAAWATAAWAPITGRPASTPSPIIKSILIRGGHPDLPLRYHPYSEKKLGWLRKFSR